MAQKCKACSGSNIAADVLRARGVRVTDLRRDVLNVLHHAGQPLGAYNLFDELNSSGKASAPPAVYRVLDFLVEQGLVHKLQSLSAYTACCAAPHQHQAIFLICRKCGDVSEREGVTVLPEQLDDFRIEEMAVEAKGVCRSCQAVS